MEGGQSQRIDRIEMDGMWKLRYSTCDSFLTLKVFGFSHSNHLFSFILAMPICPLDLSPSCSFLVFFRALFLIQLCPCSFFSGSLSYSLFLYQSVSLALPISIALSLSLCRPLFPPSLSIYLALSHSNIFPIAIVLLPARP